jgi:phosphate transport system substrate-binding protein
MRNMLFALFFIVFPQLAEARSHIHIVGSSTVFPFSAAAAEQFGRKAVFRTPIVEATGTGGGIKSFCAGEGLDTPDIANASRRMKASELEDCRKHGVTQIIEIKLGYDGIVFVNSREGKHFPLSKKAVFLALARQVPKDGKLVENPYRRWPEIDRKLPDIPIEIYGPPPTSGTRDAFVELVMLEACKQFPEYAKAYPDSEALKRECQQLREDGVYVEAGENDNLIVQKLMGNQTALAIFGYSFLEQNAAAVQAHPVDGVSPSFNAIVSGKYGVARSLYAYAKAGHRGQVPGLQEFLIEMLGQEAVGEDGYLILKGLIPLTSTELEKTRATVREWRVMK